MSPALWVTKYPGMFIRTIAFLFWVIVLNANALLAADQPNFLIIMGDDATFNDLPLYGGDNIKTPHLDKMASEGMTFNKAYLSMAMCTPCRAELYTGLYPMRNGVCWNHSFAKPGTKSAPQLLGKAGYRVGITGKVHVKPQRCFPFEYVEGFEENCVSPTAKYDCKAIETFMSRDNDQPFYLSVCLVVPHVVWTVGNADRFELDKLKLPAHMADTPQTKVDFAKYLAEIEYMDMQIGDILKTLEKSGQADNTLVLFTSEQGAQIPGCKWTNWELGVHTGMIVRWPGKTKPGVRTDALVQYADVLPTFMDAAGVAFKQKQFDGTSFLDVLTGKKNEHRQYVYAMHNNIPEGPAYPIRSVRSSKYSYIRNLTPEKLYIEKHLMGKKDHNPYWETWMFDSLKNPNAYKLIERFMKRPAEEFYDLESDPLEMNNLAGDPAYAEIKQRHSQELDRWMASQKDPQIKLDTKRAFQASKKR